LLRHAKNVVIEFGLPERSVRAIFVGQGGPLFEGGDETKEIGFGRIPFGKEVKMIGHEAEGVEQKRVARCEGNQVTQCQVAKRDVGEARDPVAGTDGNEIDSVTEIIPRSEAGIFSEEGHMQ